MRQKNTKISQMSIKMSSLKVELKTDKIKIYIIAYGTCPYLYLGK